MSRRLPPGDPLRLDSLRLAVEDGEFSIASFKLPTRWEDISPSPIAAPLDITALMVLHLATRHTDAEMATSGLMVLLEEAREALHRSVQSAHDQLHEYGVMKEELEALVEGSLRRGATRSLPSGPDEG
jgi:hypothetical protein